MMWLSHTGFNSYVVRFKPLNVMSGDTIDMFQFLNGTIKHELNYLQMIYFFVSIPIGAIQTYFKVTFSPKLVLFQFLYGAIQTIK